MTINKIQDWQLGFQNGFNTQEFIATEGQKVFILSNGNYAVGKNRLKVYVDYIIQTLNSSYFETNSTSFTLSDGVPAGSIVRAEWYESILPSVGGHASQHKAGGVDEINIKDLAGREILFYYTNVKEFGAKGDGITDDTTAFMLAIDKLSVRGGTIVVPPGDFIVNNVELPSNILIKGAGRDATIIRRSLNNPVFKTTGTPLPDGGNPSHWNISLEDMTISSKGNFDNDLTQFQGVTTASFNRMKFWAYGCRLMFANQMWDSRFTFVEFFNGGRSDGTPALELATMSGYRMTKETVIDNCHFEGYAGPAIRTLRDTTTYKTHMITFSNNKFESNQCLGLHLDLEINDSKFINTYVHTQYTTGDVIKMNNCRGIQGNLAFIYIGNVVPTSLINLIECYLIDLRILVGEPQPSNGNIITISNPTEPTINLSIIAQKPLVNNELMNRANLNQGSIWFDSGYRPRISAGKPSSIDSGGYVLTRQYAGSTMARPSGLTASDIGLMYFDQTVNKVVWFNGGSFKDANGVNPENVGINVNVTTSATLLTVTFSAPEPTNNYAVLVSPTWNTTYWITNKLTTGFTINFGSAPTSTKTLDWSIKK